MRLEDADVPHLAATWPREPHRHKKAVAMDGGESSGFRLAKMVRLIPSA